MLGSLVSFPHACGDVPPNTGFHGHLVKVFPTRVGMYRQAQAFSLNMFWFSPRVWGCTVNSKKQKIQGTVFPTRVGMYRLKETSKKSPLAFSPRVWGCTFYLENGRARIVSFPHACGDVPQ